MNCWEREFQSQLSQVREQELNHIQKARYSIIPLKVINSCATVVITLMICTLHVFLGKKLSPKIVFITLPLVTDIHFHLILYVAHALLCCADTWISVRRIQKFLQIPELSHCEKKHNAVIFGGTLQEDDVDEILISMRDVSCSWDLNDTITEAHDEYRFLALEKISVDLKKNELTFVIGPVGSGKSAFLLALAGELKVHAGTIIDHGKSIAYAAQVPWIMNGTIKENILMGLPYDQDYYREIIASCGLAVDFQHFEEGDETIVGEKGVQCSGGQRARIGLARALYRNTDILLLDDPLSAVDSKVGKLIFYSAIQNIALKRGSCVVLVTHQHQFIGSSRCLWISDGQIKRDGTFSDCVDLVGKGSEFALERQQGETGFIEDKKMAEIDNSNDIKGDKHNELNILELEQNATKPNRQEEMRVKGYISKETLLHYVRALGGMWVIPFLLLLFGTSQGAMFFCYVMIGKWSGYTHENQTSWKIVALLLSLGGVAVIVTCAQVATLIVHTTNASKKIYNQMTSSIFRAKIEFFDTNPSGWIMNRFSSDIGSVDNNLPEILMDCLIALATLTGSMIVAVVAMPHVLLIAIPLIWLFAKIRAIYLSSSREIRRIEGIARSPVYASFSESLDGMATIRSNGAEHYVLNKFQEYQDTHSRPFGAFVTSFYWIIFRMNFLVFVIATSSCILVVLIKSTGWFLDPIVIGVTLSQMIQLGAVTQFFMNTSAELMNQMVSVERVLEYCQIESEAPLLTESDEALSQEWPKSGDISIINLAARYRSSLQLSLQNVSFTVENGQRIGVVGRSGSGKSTFVQALFRILEADSGSITIDGIDISSLGLTRLRQSIGVITQRPVLLSGCTIRVNLDLSKSCNDEQIREALINVQMMEVVQKLPDGLDSIVGESDSNLSVGEQQLLCLARGILQKPKILVLDEPSANVDRKTDALIKEALDKSLPDTTIISIAHRLDTIIDSDHIAVLGGGELLEYGTPSELLEQNGTFSSMVNSTGQDMSAKLRQRAILEKDDGQ
eukprot:CAMPEP_0203667918 /NCGR_PEP_ID=MMETSP0090-20130426/4657_1 /ASSEMBLY_ACC=CAM_ASM_001088 /TAXON_ID=426623 /ORGANISM="Chaetoceros affinis, Strain CCMP159" /LENGTH=1016 /DNA_ID=CAMNT_0050532209 /DNA_START=684 /DNA_END=3731 /DNA_ORIENTATION=-